MLFRSHFNTNTSNLPEVLTKRKGNSSVELWREIDVARKSTLCATGKIWFFDSFLSIFTFWKSFFKVTKLSLRFHQQQQQKKGSVVRDYRILHELTAATDDQVMTMFFIWGEKIFDVQTWPPPQNRSLGQIIRSGSKILKSINSNWIHNVL